MAGKASAQLQKSAGQHHGHDDDHSPAVMPHHGCDASHGLPVNSYVDFDFDDHNRDNGHDLAMKCYVVENEVRRTLCECHHGHDAHHGSAEITITT